MLANDSAGAAPITGVGTTAGEEYCAAVAPGEALTTGAGGTVVLAADGQLRYNPPPGRSTGTDSFYYTVSGAAGTDVAQVTLEIAGPTIWFVDAAAAAGGDGTLLRPFDSLLAYASTAAVDPGDALFVATGAYACGISLAPSQTLFGTGSSAGFGALTGIVPVAGSLPLPSLAGPAPVLTTAGGSCLTLSTGNRLQSLVLGDRGGVGTALAGSGFGALAVRQVVIQGSGRALSLAAGTLDAALDAVAATGSATEGFFLQGVAGTLSTGAVSITSPAGVGLRVEGSLASVSLGATTVSKTASGAGVSLSGNGGAVSFASLAVTTAAGDALVAANNTGAITVASAAGSALAATGGAALSVTNAAGNPAINLSFASITTTNSPVSGIRLGRVGGAGLSVTGATAVDLAPGSGAGIDIANAATTTLSISPASTLTVADRRATGILLNAVSGAVSLGETTVANPNGATGYGLRVQASSAAVTIARANISGTVAGTPETYEPVRDTPLSDGDGDAIFVTGLTGSLTVNGGTISNTGGHAVDLRNASNVSLANLALSGTRAGAIQGVSVSGFSLADSSITTFGDEVDNDASGNEITEAALRFRDLSGTASVRRTTIVNDGTFVVTQYPGGPPNRGLELFNRGVSLTLTIAGTTFDRISNDAIVASAETGTLNLVVDGTGGDGANVFTRLNGFGVDAFEEALPGTVNLVVRGSTFDQVGAAVRFATAPGGTTVATLAGNTISSTVSSAILQRGLLDGPARDHRRHRPGQRGVPGGNVRRGLRGPRGGRDRGGRDDGDPAPGRQLGDLRREQQGGGRARAGQAPGRPEPGRHLQHGRHLGIGRGAGAVDGRDRCGLRPLDDLRPAEPQRGDGSRDRRAPGLPARPAGHLGASAAGIPGRRRRCVRRRGKHGGRHRAGRGDDHGPRRPRAGCPDRAEGGGEEMAEPFLSEIRLMSFVFAPKGWALCNGQLLPINQNQALFSLLGTTFGGDGRVNFALPDLRGRTPIHVGSGHTLGERGGEQAHTLSIAELPTHTHVRERLQRPPPTTQDPAGHGAGAVAGATAATGATGPGGPEPEPRGQRRRQPGAPQHAALPDLKLLHRAARHLPARRPDGGTLWRNPMSEKFACSRATLPRLAGCFAKASCYPSRKTRPCSS